MADYIDREETIDKLTLLFSLLKRSTIENILKAVPSADVRENVHGEWIKTEHGHKCSVCLLTFDAANNYCPNCGAKMS